MTGPQHYRAAETLLDMAEHADWTEPFAPYRDPAIAAAQVHATLALAAATAEGRINTPQQPWGGTENLSERGPEWAEVTS